MALFEGIELFGQRLQLQPKINKPNLYHYLNVLKQYEQTFALNPIQWWSRFGDSSKMCPKHICSYASANNYSMMNQQPMYQQMPHQMATSSTFTNDVDLRNDQRFHRDFNPSEDQQQQYRDRRNFNQSNWNDRNNNERKFKHYKSNKRPNPNPVSPTRPFKIIKKYQSF